MLGIQRGNIAPVVEGSLSLQQGGELEQPLGEQDGHAYGHGWQGTWAHLGSLWNISPEVSHARDDSRF